MTRTPIMPLALVTLLALAGCKNATVDTAAQAATTKQGAAKQSMAKQSAATATVGGQCRLPKQLRAPQAEQGRAVNSAVAGYTLALSWSPQYCRGKGKRKERQCDGSMGDFGFILHGLWPDAAGPNYPQYCAAAPVISDATLRANLCMTPSEQLLQHEWAKHGTCMRDTADAYFIEARREYADVRYPAMARLSRDERLTVARFVDAFVAANPGMTPAMVRVDRAGDGWLKEVRVCLDKAMAFAACPAHAKGAPGHLPLKIWRGRTLD